MKILKISCDKEYINNVNRLLQNKIYLLEVEQYGTTIIF